MGVIEAASQTGPDWTRARIAETDAIRSSGSPVRNDTRNGSLLSALIVNLRLERSLARLTSCLSAAALEQRPLRSAVGCKRLLDAVASGYIRNHEVRHRS